MERDMPKLKQPWCNSVVMHDDWGNSIQVSECDTPDEARKVARSMARDVAAAKCNEGRAVQFVALHCGRPIAKFPVIFATI